MITKPDLHTSKFCEFWIENPHGERVEICVVEGIPKLTTDGRTIRGGRWVLTKHGTEDWMVIGVMTTEAQLLKVRSLSPSEERTHEIAQWALLMVDGQMHPPPQYQLTCVRK